jgi:hypothetical protein
LPALLAAALAPGSDVPEYFPLFVGNHWVYRGVTQQLAGGRSDTFLVKIAVTGTEAIGGRTYHVLEGFDRPRTLVRRDEQGAIWEYDGQRAEERLLLPFHAPEGERINGLPRGCGPGGSIASRSHHYQGPVGEFHFATLLTLINVGTCIGGAVPETEVYLPWVGMLFRSGRSTGGVGSRFEMHLIYARLGGVTVVSEPEAAVSLSLSKRVFRAGEAPLLTARVALRDTLPDPPPRQQRFEIEIRDQRGDPVYRTFDAVPTGAGETVHSILIPLADSKGLPLGEGRYTVRAAIGGSDAPLYSASASFEIVAPGVSSTAPQGSPP